MSTECSVKWHVMSETRYKKIICTADFPSHNAQKMHLGAPHFFSLQSVVEVQASSQCKQNHQENSHSVAPGNASSIMILV